MTTEVVEARLELVAKHLEQQVELLRIELLAMRDSQDTRLRSLEERVARMSTIVGFVSVMISTIIAGVVSFLLGSKA